MGIKSPRLNYGWLWQRGEVELFRTSACRSEASLIVPSIRRPLPDEGMQEPGMDSRNFIIESMLRCD